MSRYEHGRILAVNETRLGSELVADHAAGVTTLTVEDPVDFDEDGGTLVVGGQVIDYSTFDDDTGEITLSAALGAAGLEGDWVSVYDPLYQAATVEKVAQVALDGDDDNTDAIEATVAHHLTDRLAEGIRGVTGESVRLELDGDEWRVVDVLGLANPAAGGSGGSALFYQDASEATTAGAQVLTLTHEPIQNSEHVYWNGVYQPGSEWSRTGRILTLPDPSAWVVAGDRIDVEYAYNPGTSAVEKQAPATGDPATTSPHGHPGSVEMWLTRQPADGQGGAYYDTIQFHIIPHWQFDNPNAWWEVGGVWLHQPAFDANFGTPKEGYRVDNFPINLSAGTNGVEQVIQIATVDKAAAYDLAGIHGVQFWVSDAALVGPAGKTAQVLSISVFNWPGSGGNVPYLGTSDPAESLFYVAK